MTRTQMRRCVGWGGAGWDRVGWGGAGWGKCQDMCINSARTSQYDSWGLYCTARPRMLMGGLRRTRGMIRTRIRRWVGSGCCCCCCSHVDSPPQSSAWSGDRLQPITLKSNNTPREQYTTCQDNTEYNGGVAWGGCRDIC